MFPFRSAIKAKGIDSIDRFGKRNRKKECRTIRKPGSVMTAIHLRRSLPNVCSDLPLAGAGTPRFAAFGGQTSLGLASDRACRAFSVAGKAVRSYRTISTLPVRRRRRNFFCCAFPWVSPAGRYPVSCSCEARTFLNTDKPCSDRPTVRHKRKGKSERRSCQTIFSRNTFATPSLSFVSATRSAIARMSAGAFPAATPNPANSIRSASL